jgi:hypothetical protein
MYVINYACICVKYRYPWCRCEYCVRSASVGVQHLLSEIVGAAPLLGVRHMNMEVKMLASGRFNAGGVCAVAI